MYIFILYYVVHKYSMWVKYVLYCMLIYADCINIRNSVTFFEFAVGGKREGSVPCVMACADAYNALTAVSPLQ